MTGANSGIGKAVAIGAGAGRRRRGRQLRHAIPSTAEEVVARDPERAGGQAIAHPGRRLARRTRSRRMFEQMIEEFGTIDILVNNAGLQRTPAFDEMTLEQWNTVIGVNLTGQFLCCREAVTRVQAPRRSQGGLLRRRQDHLHELGPRGDPLGRPRQLRRLQGRRHADDEEHRPGGGAVPHPRQQHLPRAPSARRSTPPPGTRRRPTPS